MRYCDPTVVGLGRFSMVVGAVVDSNANVVVSDNIVDVIGAVPVEK